MGLQVARIQKLLAQAAVGSEIGFSTPSARVLRSNSSWSGENTRASLDGGVSSTPPVATPPARSSPIALSGLNRTMLGPDANRAAAEMGRELIGGESAQALLDADALNCARASYAGFFCATDGQNATVERMDCTDEKAGATGCYDLHLAPFYSNLCSLFLVPLFSDRAGAEELASELLCVVANGSAVGALPPGSGLWLADLVSNPLPPALLLRIVLLRLKWITPTGHPDWEVC